MKIALPLGRAIILLGSDRVNPAILDAKEERVRKQTVYLQACNNCLISFTMNIPGDKKDGSLIRTAFLAGCRVLQGEGFSLLERSFTAAGAEAFFKSDLSPEKTKAITVALESAAPIGRLWDLDVLTPEGEKLSRGETRNCLVCGDSIEICVKENRHTLQEVLDIVNPILKCNAPITLAQLAVDALLEEVHLTPKPGLVDSENQGAHEDMDLSLFEASANALLPYFEKAVSLGMEREDCMEALQNAGLEAEKTMLEVTGGVNTHKGAIYAFGLLLAAMGSHLTFGSEIFSVAASLAAEGIPPQTETHGETVRKKYRRVGARQEALEGFPNAISAYNVLLETGSPYRALLWLMASVPDTNLLYRGGADGLIFVQELAKATQAQPDDKLMEALWEMDRKLIDHRLSPGGCADLLALGLFLQKTEDIWND